MDQIQIADYLAKKVFNGELTSSGDYIMLKNKQIYSVLDYGELIESYKLSPEDVFVYFNLRNYSDVELYKVLVKYLFPLVAPSIYDIVDSYLDKLGFYATDYPVYPATSLKYYAVVVLFSDRLVIELTDIDTAATNTGLRKIVEDVLGKDILTQREISWDQIIEIHSKLEEQKLFAGYNLDMTYNIIDSYYEEHDTSLAKDVLAIANAYNQIFQPYRVVYDTKTKRQVLI